MTLQLGGLASLAGLSQPTDDSSESKEAIEMTQLADMKELFYEIIKGQTKNRMLAEASPQYAFNTVNKPMLPEEKSKPLRSLIYSGYCFKFYVINSCGARFALLGVTGTTYQL